jgi:hypothetical protein
VKRDSAVLAAISLLAFAACWLCGMRLPAGDLENAWHLLDAELLRHDLLRSVFYLHAQPPLLNLVVGTALKLFGSAAPAALTILWASCAIAAVLATHHLALRLGARRWAAFVAGASVAVAPATWLYVHHVGPEMATAAALVGSAAFVAQGTRRSLWTGFALLGIACCLRSLLAPPAVLVALAIVGRKGVGPALAVFAVLAAISLKNAAIAGTLSTSSWVGMNFARVTVARLPPAQRNDLSPVAALAPFSSGEEYAALVPVAHTGVAALDQLRKSSGATNYNALVFARVSRMLLRDDLRAIRTSPRAVFSGWALSWMLFFRPAGEWHYIAENRQRIAPWASFWDRVVCLELPLPFSLLGQTEVFLTLLAGVALIARSLLRAPGPGLWYAVVLIACVACLGNTFDVGENYRFRFLVAPLWAAVAAAGWRGP